MEKNEPSAWAKESWEETKADGVMDGTNPKDTLTREQAAAIYCRAKDKLLSYLKDQGVL